MKKVDEYVEREIVKRVFGHEFRYIRADVAQAQLDAANARITERENAIQSEVYAERMRADGLRKQIDELEAWQETAQRMEDANQLQRQVIATQKQRIAELEAEMHAIRFAAHMPDDYEHGLPSWINQHLYGKLVDWTDVDGLPIRRSEDVEHMIRQNRRIAELEAAQAWISVDERLPDAEVDVLCWTGSGCTIGFRTPNSHVYGLTWIVSRGNGTITHWMPLPPPPVTPET